MQCEFPGVDLRKFSVDAVHPSAELSEAEFRDISDAGRNAFSEAFKNAGPKILEPIYDVEVFVPSDKMGDVMSDLQGRRGMIMGMSSENGYEKLVAKVPLKEMSSYSTSLSSLTGGRASFIMKFASYELVPGDVQDKLMKEFEANENKDE